MAASIEIKDLNKIKTPSALSLNRKKDAFAFIVTQPDQKENRYLRNIWIYKNRSARQLTVSDKDSDFIWDDDETLLFVSGREKQEEKPGVEKTDFYRINIHGGEAVKAFSIPKDVLFFKKLEDKKYCFGIKDDRNALPVLADNEKEREEEQDYHVIDEVPLWANGKGYVSGIRTGLYLYDEKENMLEKISSPYIDIASADYKDGKLLVLGKDWKDVIDETDSLLLYDIETKKMQTLIPQGELAISKAVFVDDEIILTATDQKPYGIGQYHDFYRYDKKSEKAALVTKTNRLLGIDIMTDSCQGYGKDFIVHEDSIYAIGQCAYRDSIFTFSDGEFKESLVWDGLISCMDKSENGFVFCAMPANGLCEIYESVDGDVKKLTDFNDAFLAEHFVSEAKYIPFVNSAGIMIDGWVLEPKDFDENKKYPGVLEIHGGPRCTYGEVFFHEMQIWASHGWFVFYCNPRGSEGYGEEFADLRGKYGKIDYEDLMEFTDHVLSVYPQLDKDSLGASGGSYGGFMCNWIEGHTDRFAAIASQRSVSNWVSDFGCSEIGISFDTNEMKATPWTGMEQMWDCSPLKYAHNAKTPILFIHSLQDYNCTIDQGVQMFTAVKHFGVPARMCLFEGENHSLSRNGKPLHRMRRLKEMTGWFETYLTDERKGQD